MDCGSTKWRDMKSTAKVMSHSERRELIKSAFELAKKLEKHRNNPVFNKALVALLDVIGEISGV